MPTFNSESIVKLPAPNYDGRVSVEHALLARRSVRSFSTDSISPEEISQLLWSAQGITSPKGYRTAPSAGALYPLEVYAVLGNVGKIPAGIYKYLIGKHALLRTVAGDCRMDIGRAALNQSFIARAPVILLFSTVDERVTNKYGERGLKYILMEVGHAAQNVCLQAVALGLSTVVVGAFRDEEISTIANLAKNELPIYIMPIGR